MDYLKIRAYEASVKKAWHSTAGRDFFNGKKVMVLGASGLIGSFMTDCLLWAAGMENFDIKVIAVGRSRERLEERFGGESEALFFAEADVSSENIGDVLRERAPDVIIHAASRSYPSAFITNPVDIMKSNINGITNILDYAKTAGNVRIVYISSGEVLSDIDHTVPRACYPVSKKAAETMCLSYVSEYGTDAMIARPCHTFGANVTALDNHASAQFIRLAAEGKDIVLKSSGSQTRTYAYVPDCVSGVLSAGACGSKGGIYNVASDEALSIRDFAGICANAAGSEVIMEGASEREVREMTTIDRQIMDADALKELGWKPVFRLEDGIRECIEITRSAML